MMNLLKKKSLSLGLLLVMGISVAGCNTPSGTTTPTPGQNSNAGKAGIIGMVTKADGSVANNATIVLIKKESEKDSDAQILRSNDKGEFIFEKVEKGNYRVAFVIQTEQERKDKTPIAYDPTGKTGDYFGAITTNSFDYDGDKTKTLQIPSFNVGWKSTLSPHNTDVDISKPVKFSWGKVNDGNVKGYNVLIKNSSDNTVFKSAELSAETLEYSLEGDNLKKLEKGKDYQYIVNVLFNKPASADVYLTAGNSPNGLFKTK